MEDFSERILAKTSQEGVHVILDFVGASYWSKNIQSIGSDGRWILIGILGGTVVEEINLWSLMEKRVHLKGTLLTPRDDKYKENLTKQFKTEVLPHFKTGAIQPIIDQVFSFHQIMEAHNRMEENKNIGKIIVKVSF